MCASADECSLPGSLSREVAELAIQQNKLLQVALIKLEFLLMEVRGRPAAQSQLLDFGCLLVELGSLNRSTLAAVHAYRIPLGDWNGSSRGRPQLGPATQPQPLQ